MFQESHRFSQRRLIAGSPSLTLPSMQQLVGHLGTGEVELIDVPRPRPGAGELLVANEFSVVSAGTERMLVAFGAASLVGKARQEPGRVRQVIDKAMTDGVRPTVEAVQARLEMPLPLGYSAAGVVVEVGEGVRGFAVGDRVATNASHAEVALVSSRLAAHIPASVGSRDAAFTTVAAVAMNALREAEVEVGGVVAILGLGLIGQIAARVAEAAGCRVIGLDPIEGRADSIKEGFSDAQMFAARVSARTDEAGADAVLIATDSSTPETTALAAAVTRVRGTVVLVGAGDPTLDRRAFYERELRFVVSHAYGAGRDELDWERGLIEYPRHRVRWTAQRNFEAVLDLMERGSLSFDGIHSVELALGDAADAYAELKSGVAPVATVFRYDSRVEATDQVELRPSSRSSASGVSVIGAGNFAERVLIPALRATNARLRLIASRGGLSSVLAGRKHGFEATTTNLQRIWDDEAPIVFVATPHETHVDIAIAAMEAGKHVWVEKPLSIDREGLDRLEHAALAAEGVVMAGFNRRFAPTTVELVEDTRGRGPFSMVYTVNAGALPSDHWLRDPARGGGRLVGEACHFVDLLRFIADAPISDLKISPIADGGTLTMSFADGSIGTVHYFTSGHLSVPKERLEVFASGRVWQLDNFRDLRVSGGGFDPVGKLKRLGRVATQDKGHQAAVAAFVEAARSGAASPIPFSESIEISRAIFDALDS